MKRKKSKKGGGGPQSAVGANSYYRPISRQKDETCKLTGEKKRGGGLTTKFTTETTL